MPISMLADFAIRLACGLAIMLLATPWRVVPPPFFRTHCQVILGLLVLAGLSVSQTGGTQAVIVAISVTAGLGYITSVAWGLGLPRVGLPITALIALVTGCVLVMLSERADRVLWALNAAGALASALLMGSTLTAMLLGHYYLTAPAMSIEPLKRFVRCMGVSLAVRGALAAAGCALWGAGRSSSATPQSLSTLFLAMRWGMGFAGPALATVLTWKTVQIRSTQSATGILLVALVLVLIGELTAMILTRGTGVLF